MIFSECYMVVMKTIWYAKISSRFVADFVPGEPLENWNCDQSDVSFISLNENATYYSLRPEEQLLLVGPTRCCALSRLN